jgi:pimeloyl-ACP methyl ester carboxylesterase
MLHLSSAKKSTVVRSPSSIRIARAALQAAFLVSDDLGASLAERLFSTPRRHARPERERAAIATARPFTIDVPLKSPRWHGQTVKVAAWRWGNGPTALLVHGWEGRGSQLGAFAAPLVAAGMSVVTFDAPAHGDSIGSRMYLTDLADTIAAAAAATGPLHAIIAHSFGVAATLLAHARGGIDAPRTIAVSPNVVLDQALTSFAKTVALDQADRAVFETHLAASAGVSTEIMQLDQLVGARDTQLLVVHDRDDREVPFAQGTQLAQAWPHAQLVATDGLGHRRILRDKAVIARVAQFASHGVRPPASDLVREVDRCLADGDLE